MLQVSNSVRTLDSLRLKFFRHNVFVQVYYTACGTSWTITFFLLEASYVLMFEKSLKKAFHVCLIKFDE